jgi:hypothetical protein
VVKQVTVFSPPRMALSIRLGFGRGIRDPPKDDAIDYNGILALLLWACTTRSSKGNGTRIMVELPVVLRDEEE